MNTKEEIIEGNCIIADWLGWGNEYCPGSYFPPINTGIKNVVADFELQFHNNMNWLWIVLEKIALLENCNAQQAIDIIGSEADSKQALFNAIVKYIKNDK